MVENFKVGDMARYGLAYDDLKGAQSAPRSIAPSSGFGQTGPYAPRAGYDLLAQGLGGIMSVTGEPDRPPMKVGVGIADIMCGMYAAAGDPGGAASPGEDRRGSVDRPRPARHRRSPGWSMSASTT